MTYNCFCHGYEVETRNFHYWRAWHYEFLDQLRARPAGLSIDRKGVLEAPPKTGSRSNCNSGAHGMVMCVPVNDVFVTFRRGNDDVAPAAPPEPELEPTQEGDDDTEVPHRSPPAPIPTDVCQECGVPNKGEKGVCGMVGCPVCDEAWVADTCEAAAALVRSLLQESETFLTAACKWQGRDRHSSTPGLHPLLASLVVAEGFLRNVRYSTHKTHSTLAKFVALNELQYGHAHYERFREQWLTLSTNLAKDLLGDSSLREGVDV